MKSRITHLPPVSCCKGLIFFLWTTAKTKCYIVMSNIFPGQIHAKNKLHRIIFSKISITPPTVSSADQDVTLSRSEINDCISKLTLHTHTHTLSYSLQPLAAAYKPGCSGCVEMSGISCWVPSDALLLTGVSVSHREVTLSK